MPAAAHRRCLGDPRSDPGCHDPFPKATLQRGLTGPSVPASVKGAPGAARWAAWCSVPGDNPRERPRGNSQGLTLREAAGGVCRLARGSWARPSQARSGDAACAFLVVASKGLSRSGAELPGAVATGVSGLAHRLPWVPRDQAKSGMWSLHLLPQ